MPEMPDGSFEIDAEFANSFIEHYKSRPMISKQGMSPAQTEAVDELRMQVARERFPKLFANNPRPIQLGLNQKDYRAWTPTPMDPGMEPNLEQVVFEALGLAATCWSDLSNAGRFESENLSALSERLVEVLRERGAE